MNPAQYFVRRLNLELRLVLVLLAGRVTSSVMVSGSESDDDRLRAEIAGNGIEGV